MTMTDTEKRPSLNRQHTRKTDATREDALNVGVRMTLDGKTYEARVGDVTPQIARRLRRETGFGFMSLMSELSNDPDIDVVQAFVWVARMVAGEAALDIDEVQASYASLLSDGFDVVAAGAEEIEADSPEA